MGALTLGQGAGLASVQSLLDSGLATLHLLRQDLPHFHRPEGLKVRQMNPSLVRRVGTSYSATAAYSAQQRITRGLPPAGARPAGPMTPLIALTALAAPGCLMGHSMNRSTPEVMAPPRPATDRNIAPDIGSAP